MKTIKVKTLCSNNYANTTLAHPDAELGDFRDASLQVRQINNVPEEVKTADVIRLFSGTTQLSNQLELDYSELGIGRIVIGIGPSDIRHLRRSLNLNTTEFGALVGVSGRTIEDYEQGRRRPSGPAQKILAQLAKTVPTK